MRIRMKTRAAAPGLGRVLQPGDVVEVDAATAQTWIQLGCAVPAGREPVETATLPPGEERAAGLESLIALPGIGPKTARRLADAGLDSAEALGRASVATVMQAAGVGRKRAEGWIVAAMKAA